jgi:hypothetical protein
MPSKLNPVSDGDFVELTQNGSIVTTSAIGRTTDPTREITMRISFIILNLYPSISLCH